MNGHKSERDRRMNISPDKPDNSLCESRSTHFSHGNLSLSETGSVLTEITNLGGSTSEIGKDGSRSDGDLGNNQKNGKEKSGLEKEDPASKHLLYGVMDSPPIHLTTVCALQVSGTCIFFVKALTISLKNKTKQKTTKYFNEHFTKKSVIFCLLNITKWQFLGSIWLAVCNIYSNTL